MKIKGSDFPGGHLDDLVMRVQKHPLGEEVQAISVDNLLARLAEECARAQFYADSAQSHQQAAQRDQQLANEAAARARGLGTLFGYTDQGGRQLAAALDANEHGLLALRDAEIARMK